MEDKLQSFRQPLVTANGIILGFLINYAYKEVNIINFKAENPFVYVDGVLVIIGICFLIISMKRILSIDYPKDDAINYYKKTLNYFVIGISIALIGVLFDMYVNPIDKY
jgi:hypothetical protein